MAPCAHAGDQTNGAAEKSELRSAIRDSFTLAISEHLIRLTFEPKTRRALEGPFWRDYTHSVRMPRQWEDGDRWLVNYVGHPLNGAAAGFIWLSHDPISRRERFGFNHRYWSTRWRPLAWSAAYSLQFEIGPFSEASIGNIGLRPENAGWVDHVVTPVAGLGFIIAEDALDDTFITWFEQHVRNRTYRASIRMLFNPARTLANVSSYHLPWYRERRPLTAIP